MPNVLDAVPDALSGGFFDLLARWKAASSIGSDDIVASVLPLCEQVRRLHDNGHVAPLDGVDLLRLVEDRELWFNASDCREPRFDSELLLSIERSTMLAIDVTGEIEVVESSSGTHIGDRRIAERGHVPDQPRYYLDYSAWELALGLQDPLTDIFLLGMLMGSLATRLDFTQPRELQQFLSIRRNLHGHNNRIHPALSRLIADMTELRRIERAQDLTAIIDTLENYRKVEPDDFDHRLADLEAITNPDERRALTQDYLRNRLFEVSRRNRLVYFKDTAATADLTVGSLPYTLDYRNVKASQIFYTNEKLCKELERKYEADGADSWLPLQQYMRFEDYPFLGPKLDKVRLEAQADIKEYGFSQLRLVLAFLRWHNLVRDKDERINSPLVLLPVNMNKQRGTENGFSISPASTLREAEINPVLAHHIRDVYGIELPETIDMTRMSNLEKFRADLLRQIHRRHPGVVLETISRPRIQLIHHTVKRQVEDFNRRRKRTGRGLRDYGGFAYSYDSDNYAPLGITLFNQFVRVMDAPGREMVDRGSPLDSAARPELERETSRDFYSLDNGENSDPMRWEINLTAVSLSNFNYRKMSLVRDYSELKAGRIKAHDNFDRLFSSDVRAVLPPTPKPDWLDRHLVLPTDPSQEEAVMRARTGASYVIQGPPGTGKSQTIANLLADFAARGKKVLFVCEKRVALDVVHHRLNEAGLGDLTCLVHDTKSDKKAFVAELKSIYQTWREEQTSKLVANRRNQLAGEIGQIIAELEKFSTGINAPGADAGHSLHDLVTKAVDRGTLRPWLEAEIRERLPHWSAVALVAEPIAEIEQAARAELPPGLEVQRLFRFLRLDLVKRGQLVAYLQATAPQARAAIETIAASADTCITREGKFPTTRQIVEQCALAELLRPLAAASKLELLDDRHPERARFDEAARKFALRLKELDEIDRSGPWSAKLSPQDTRIALDIARRREGQFFSFLFGDWRKVRRRIAAAYRGEVLSHVAVLENLAGEHEVQQKLKAEMGAFASVYGADELDALLQMLDAASAARNGSSHQRIFLEHCSDLPRLAEQNVLKLAQANGQLVHAATRLDEILTGYGEQVPKQLSVILGDLERHAASVAELLPRLCAVENSAPDVAACWRAHDLAIGDLENAALIETTARAFKAAPAIARFDGARLNALATRLTDAIAELRDLNAKHATENCRGRFRENIALMQATSRNSPKLDEYREGCRQLEHQFGLQRPSKSLRELLTGASGSVLRDLKPIWMMSPLSVADTLPFDDELFDAVVFDEASQIPLEDAVPTLYRARQTIMVGDEMQLPPTSFFSSSQSDDEPMPDYLAYAVSADSLLTRAAATLGSTRLNWHYRSRHESLINFCNCAFYGGELNTVPSRRPLKPTPAIRVKEGTNRRAFTGPAERLVSSPISFHHVQSGVFRNQRNEAEADYIAELVAAFLKKETGKSIGIVGFSRTQAQAIETALESLAGQDRKFAQRLEAERDRDIDGQFAGLFVKNLENVQGDERDVIIISIGYASGPDGKMRMNFGPINQAGGEKRLNVIFSRAKSHVAVVSSVEHSRITNDYNIGANTLKQYLRYAAAVSAGEESEIHHCLDKLGPAGAAASYSQHLPDPVARHIAAEIAADEQRFAELGFGQSSMRADVAVRAAEADEFTHAILVDTKQSYEITDIVERYVTRPAVFRAFGWEVEHRLGKDLVLRQEV